jgi:RNA polymerase sigma-70 factor (ECF subfamily)
MKDRSGRLTVTSDNLLVAMARSGDHSAFAELCMGHRAMILRLAARITGNLADAEDVLQDAWMRAYINLNTFDGRSAFVGWVTRIAINSALTLLRKRRHRRELSLDASLYRDATESFDPIEPSPSPEELCIAAETEAILQWEVRKMNAKLRGAIEIRQEFDGPIKVLARCAGIPVATMKTRLHRARMRLRERLPETTCTSRQSRKERRAKEPKQAIPPSY